MIDYFTYAIMQFLGYRKYYFDWAFARGIPLSSFQGWFFYPFKAKGTYRETKAGYEFVGYGVDK
jgi:hypothetical protein